MDFKRRQIAFDRKMALLRETRRLGLCVLALIMRPMAGTTLTYAEARKWQASFVMLQIPPVRAQTAAKPNSQAVKDSHPRIKNGLLEYGAPCGDYKFTEPGPDDRMHRDLYEPYVSDGTAPGFSNDVDVVFRLFNEYVMTLLQEDPSLEYERKPISVMAAFFSGCVTML